MTGPLVLIAAGEVSGDMLAAELMQALAARVPGIRFVGIGGRRMREAGLAVLADVTPHSAVGLVENLQAARPVGRAYARARAELKARAPDLVLGVDYQGANVPLLRAARRRGLPTAYYVLPQDWLWGLPGGLGRVARAADRYFALFEPEAEAYAEAGAAVSWVGHPLVERFARVRAREAPVPGAPARVGLFPGSRDSEIRALLPIMVEAARRASLEAPGRYTWVLPVADPRFEASLRAAAGALPGATVVPSPTPSLWGELDAAWVASGTATLEAALAGVPIAACYRVAPVTAWVARRLMRHPHVTLPNILSGEAVIPELLQDACTPDALARSLAPLVHDPAAREKMREGYARARAKLGAPGASGRVADALAAWRGWLPEQA